VRPQIAFYVGGCCNGVWVFFVFFCFFASSVLLLSQLMFGLGSAWSKVVVILGGLKDDEGLSLCR